jgi:ribonuclease Z
VRVIFLGTGGSMPSPKRNVTAVALQVGPEIILFDCGEGTQRQFMLSSASFMKVSSVFITHLHGDHFLGLPALIQSMAFSGRTEPLSVLGPEGTIALVRSLLCLGYFTSTFDIEAMEMKDGDKADYPGFQVTAVRTEHTVPSLGYVLEENERPGRFQLDKAMELGVPEGPLFRKLQQGQDVTVDGKKIRSSMVLGPARRGRKVAISGDTRPSDWFAQAVRGADLLIHEATVDSSLIKDADAYGHSTAQGAAQVAKEAGVGVLYLYHVSNRYEDPTPILDEARMVFENTFVAEDFMTVQVPPPK